MSRYLVLILAAPVLGLALVPGCAGEGEPVIEPVVKTWAVVAAGEDPSCAVADDGELRCFGCIGETWDQFFSFGLCIPPRGRFVDVAVGQGHTCGLRVDGEAVCWGWCEEGQCLAAPGPFEQLVAGPTHSCGLRVDGSVAWGGCGVNGSVVMGSLDPCRPPDARFQQINAIDHTSCGLDAEGRIHCWGTYDELVLPTDVGYVQIDLVGSDSGCALRDDGQVTCWGLDDIGVPATPFRSIGVGSEFGCGLDDSGAVTCWGEKPATPPPAGEFVQISVVERLACAVSAAGEVVCWGEIFGFGEDGPLGDRECH